MKRRCVLLAVWSFCAVGWTSRVNGQDPRLQGPPLGGVPAPHRDINGIWRPLIGAQGTGAAAMPADGKPEHQLLYTPYGLEMAKRNRSSNGPDAVAAVDENDPAHACDPQGFPREDFFELRTTQFIQTPLKTVLLYTYGKVYRVVWTDGRALPVDPDPHWYGYSAGKWTDDFTFVVDTIGTDPRTWVDNAGRPHSEDLHVTEVFRRVDRDNMTLTVTLDDPKVYQKPWVGLKDVRFTLMPPATELVEMLCSPSELAVYNKRYRSTTNKK